MRMIISPAKKMKSDDGLPFSSLPAFLEQSEEVLKRLQSMTPSELQQLWKCNDAIAAQNVERLAHMDLRRNLSPAILSYDGIQYQYMASTVFTEGEYDYLQEHLRIVSAFYGLLRPFDGVTPYRLEMQAKLSVGGQRDLYGFWGEKLAKQLMEESDVLIDLASKEYSRSITPYLPADYPLIRCQFVEETGGKLVEKGTLCKMARGEMVRWMAEQGLHDPKQLKEFEGRNHRFAPEYSNERLYVFLKKEPID